MKECTINTHFQDRRGCTGTIDAIQYLVRPYQILLVKFDKEDESNLFIRVLSQWLKCRVKFEAEFLNDQYQSFGGEVLVNLFPECEPNLITLHLPAGKVRLMVSRKEE